MSHFNDLNYDAKTQTVKLESGLTWDEVYRRLDPLNVTVVGGRVSGVGKSCPRVCHLKPSRL